MAFKALAARAPAASSKPFAACSAIRPVRAMQQIPDSGSVLDDDASISCRHGDCPPDLLKDGEVQVSHWDR